MTRSPLFFLGTLAVLLAVSGPSAAEEPAGEKVPVPDAARGFAYRGAVVRDGHDVGTFHLAARVSPLPGRSQDGEPHWRLEERRAWREAEAPLALDATAWADGALAPVEGTLEETDAWGAETTYAWKRRGDGFRVQVRSEARTPMEREATVEAPALTTLAALVLRGRLAEGDVAETAVHLFDPSWEYLQAERPFTKGMLTLTTEARWRERPATVLTWTADDQTIVVALGPEDRALLGVEVQPKQGTPLLLRPGEVPPPGADAADARPFTAPARSPEACALRVALAFLTADVDLFDETIHWGSLRESHPDIVKGEVSGAEFRAAIRAQFEAKKQAPQDRDRAEAFLRSIEEELEVRPGGDARVTVVLPEAFGRMRLTVGRVAGVWYLIRLPGT